LKLMPVLRDQKDIEAMMPMGREIFDVLRSRTALLSNRERLSRPHR
jgi:hypothetical protein